MKKTADELINEIKEILSESSGEFIADIANRVLTKKVEYIEDGFFEQK